MQRRLLVHCYKSDPDEPTKLVFTSQRLVSLPVVRNGDAECLSRAIEIVVGYYDTEKELPETAAMVTKLRTAFAEELKPSGFRCMEHVQLRVMQVLHD